MSVLGGHSRSQLYIWYIYNVHQTSSKHTSCFVAKETDISLRYWLRRGGPYVLKERLVSWLSHLCVIRPNSKDREPRYTCTRVVWFALNQAGKPQGRNRLCRKTSTKDQCPKNLQCSKTRTQSNNTHTHIGYNNSNLVWNRKHGWCSVLLKWKTGEMVVWYRRLVC